MQIKSSRFKGFNVQCSRFNVRDWFKIVSFCFQIVESLRATTSTINILNFTIYDSYNLTIPCLTEYFISSAVLEMPILRKMLSL